MISQRMITLIIPLVLILFSLVFFIYFISALIFRRLDKLAAIMKKVQKGDFDIRIPVDSMDEVGQLKQAFNTMVDKINYLFNTMYKLKIAEKDAALSYLQSQMNPHFLHNTLETVRMIAQYERNTKISDIIGLLGKLLKYNIRINTPVSIKEELDIVQSYIAIQNIRFDDKITLHLDVEEQLLNHPIKKLIIQPLVENSVSYGFSEMLEGCMLRIEIKKTDECILIRIEDNGQGFAPERLEEINDLLAGRKDESLVSVKGSGIGLLNINTRLKLRMGIQAGLRLTVSRGKKHR